jgi:hypothetical protein
MGSFKFVKTYHKFCIVFGAQSFIHKEAGISLFETLISQFSQDVLLHTYM